MVFIWELKIFLETERSKIMERLFDVMDYYSARYFQRFGVNTGEMKLLNIV